MRFSSSWYAAATALLAGCLVGTPDPGDEPNTDPAVDALEDPAHPGLEACTAGLDPATVDLHLDLAAAYRDSLAEMVTCGQLAQGFTGNLVLVLVNAASGSDSHPSGFTYEGDGIYSAGAQMQVAVHLAEDTSFGNAGDRITWDLFEPSNWFTELTVRASASVDLSGETRTELEIDFGGTAPGAELLGVNAGESGTIELDTDQIRELLGNLELRSFIRIEEDRIGTQIVWEVDTPAGKVGDLFSNDAELRTQLIDASGTHPETGQAMVLGEWAIGYTTGHGGTTDGTVTFDVLGGEFDYGVTMTYPHRRTADVALHCL